MSAAIHRTYRCPLQAAHRFRNYPERPDTVCPNGDIQCWFCGSWNIDQFLAWCRKILSGEISPAYETAFGPMPRMELNDRRDKIYVKQDGVLNAMEGAIKVKTAHLLPEHLDVVNRALKLCRANPNAPGGAA